ncbi:hypothetical protein [uncultured Polaribacter sp.]|uniref:hypothetical protein n=1 Tax=uncultured Polaribacter sp. TaxID=174711 RepID=UPI00260860F5|nr:hypothetical protein [uncultured Polaribacter sp.]
MKKIILILVLVSFYSCELDIPWIKPDNRDCVKFTEKEYNFLPTEYKNKDTLIFKNQFNEIIKYKVGFYHLEKCSFDYLNDSVELDKLSIILDIIKDDGSYSPQNCYEPRFHFFKNENGGLDSYIQFSTEQNECRNISLSLNYEESYQEYTINNIKYKNVKIFEFNKDSLVTFFPNNKSNIVYYDLKFGVLGFDSIDGKIWRIEN